MRDDPAALDEAELNLTPYLDVVMNLVVFLLASLVAARELRLIDVEAPAGCATCATPAGFEPRLTLTQEEAIIEASDGSVPAERIAGPLDPERLTEALAGWRTRHGLDEVLTVTADPALPYATLVMAMDAAREAEGRPLFPRVRLALAKRSMVKL